MNTWRQTIVAAMIMGLIAAALVWYLERFNSDRLAAEIRDYLANHDRFNAEYPEKPDA